MPSKPTGQEENKCFDQNLSLRGQQIDHAAGPKYLENDVENCAFQDDFLLQVSVDNAEQRDKLAKANTLSSRQSILCMKPNTNPKQRPSSINDDSNSYIEPSEHVLTESTSFNSTSNIPKSNKTVSENCNSNYVHIASVHKNEKKVDTSAEDDNKYSRREEISTAKKGDRTEELLLDDDRGKEKHNGRPIRVITMTCKQLIVISVVMDVVILALVSVVIFLCIRDRELNLTKITSSGKTSNIKTSTLYVNWDDTNTVDSNQYVNITLLAENRNKFISVERDIININLNGTYGLYLSLNIDIPNIQGMAFNESIRNTSLICLKTNRYDFLCQRQRSLPNTACTVSIKGVFPLWEGDKIWVSVMGINQIYKSKANNRLVIIKHPLF
ncbi:uncharacterized protein LOC134688504 [Mytilus trossulus]|uniref:uncharacterized protein LOC134688504 n=1 Tax=Mytilus trossulus TaxID=6551 RepID=UPI0030063454